MELDVSDASSHMYACSALPNSGNFFQPYCLIYLESAPGDKAVSHSCTTPSTSSASGLNPTSAPPTSASAVPVSPVPQSPIPPLLQDPNLLRQLLPALQATLQLNNSNVDISKINEGKFS